MDLQLLLDQFRVVRDDIKAGKIVTALEDTLPLQKAIYSGLRAVGFQAAPGDEAKAKACAACLDEAIALCDQPIPVGADPTEVGKLGDGKILKGLLELFKQLLPVILPLIIP